MTDASAAGPTVRVQLRVTAKDMLPAVLASLDHPEVTTEVVRLAATHAVRLTRDVNMPAVPRVGDLLAVSPYPDELDVEEVLWVVDPQPGEATVLLGLSDVDFDQLAGEQAEALLEFFAAGWVIDDLAT